MYDREFDLSSQFNRAFADLLNIGRGNYYSRLTPQQILNLKTALSNINNIITMRLTFNLAHLVCYKLKVEEQTEKSILSSVQRSKPGSNGFDIEHLNPNIVAEVKCNIPINGGTNYGSAQINGLKKDINSLLNGKKKSSMQTKDAFKILGLYDSPEVRVATTAFIKTLPIELVGKIIIDDKTQILDSDHIYVFFVDL